MRLPRVTVIGLGPAGPDLLTSGTLARIERVPHRYLRTARHPAASALPAAPSFDHLYDTADSFDEVYAAIVESLVAAASEHGEVLYAVPGSPVVAERTVELGSPGVEVDADNGLTGPGERRGQARDGGGLPLAGPR